MNKKVCAVIVHKKFGVLTAYKEDYGWILPTWSCREATDSMTPLKIGIKNDITTDEFKVQSFTEVQDTFFYVIYFDKAKNINEIKSQQYSEFEYRPYEIVRDLAPEELYTVYKIAFIRLKRFLEPAYKRWLRISLKAMAALVLLLMPFAILWNILKNQ